MSSLTLFLIAVKALVLVSVATAITLSLRSRPARLRAVVLGTALIGTLLIPAVSAVVPSMSIPVPMDLSGDQSETATAAAPPFGELRLDAATRTPATAPTDPRTRFSGAGRTVPDIGSLLIVIWAIGASLFVARQTTGVVRTIGVIRRADELLEPPITGLVDAIREQTGCRRRVRVVATREVDVPAIFGLRNPVVILPAHYGSWLEDRLEAVLKHELIHAVRFDWPVRAAARLACAVYWFNPLGWWAARRLDLEQEMACDEEVLALGSRPSIYACHLLGIARVAVHRPTLAIAGLEMARRSDLEERIMRLLQHSKHRRIGLAVVFPAVVFTAALVPAIASVQPTERERQASPALTSAMNEMRDAEKRLEPFLDKIDIHVDAARPSLEKIKQWEAQLDQEEIARVSERIEAEMAPILAQIENIQIDMEPYHAQIEAVQQQLESMTYHIDDGTLEEIQRQIHEHVEAHRAQIEAIHIDLGPYHEQLERLHTELEPLYEELARISAEQSAKLHEQLDDEQVVLEIEHGELERMHEEMEKIHQEMAPLEKEMERIGDRIESALVSDLAKVLRSHLASVVAVDAPFEEAAARIVGDGNIHVNDDVLRLEARRSEVRQILRDLLAGGRVGGQDAFDEALEAAVDEVSDLRIRID
jgi:beta-lactamase regulating signal transducer with metallopeptidase domain/predicted  nucleic acid-binding Zn-ribbon protein